MSLPVSTEIALRKVLFAMDFSLSSLTAFPFAASVARRFEGEVVLAHITSLSENPSDDPVIRTSLENVLTGAEEGLLASHGASKTPHELRTDYGTLCPTLISMADKCNVDLIVIGTHGLAGVRKLLRGSKAEEIMCLSSKPVLIVGPQVSRNKDFKNILYATDFSPAALRALAYADSIKRAYRGSLVVLHVNDGTSEEQPAEATSKTLRFLEDAHSQGYVEHPEKFEMLVEFGPRAERILEAAKTRRADLIVLGVHSRTGIKARIRAHLPGSTAFDVISQARCPVLTVPALPSAK